MKKIYLITMVAVMAVLCSCSHNASLVGVGTAFRLGSGEVSLNYADGLFLSNVSRDNVKFCAELDSTMGVTYDPVSNSYKGIKSISYEIGPQLGGYSKELGYINPDALKAYYEASAKYYEYRKAQDAQPAASKTAISEEKSKDATSKVMDAFKNVLSKIKWKAGDSDAKDDDKSTEPFECKDGNCELTNLDAITTRTFQTAVANKLMTYADDTTTFEGSPTTLKKSLEMFQRRMEQYKAKSIDDVAIRVRRATIKNSVLKDIKYVYSEDGKEFETECPECVFIPILDVSDPE